VSHVWKHDSNKPEHIPWIDTCDTAGASGSKERQHTDENDSEKKFNCLASPHAAGTMEKSDSAHHAKDRTNLPSPTETPIRATIGAVHRRCPNKPSDNQAESNGKTYLCLAHKRNVLL
jgi:hypothetical protein